MNLAYGVLIGLNWSVLVMVVVRRKLALVIFAAHTVALGVAESASLEALTVSLLTPRLLAAASSS